jgi:hypothetical protein
MCSLPVSTKELYEEYLNCVGLDTKPEKGERKIADDFIILINEVSSKQTDQELIYLVSLNDSALQLSPYNFDI